MPRFQASPQIDYPPANAAVAESSISNINQTNNLRVNNLNDGGSALAQQPNELVNDSVALNQPAESNQPTPEALARMQYNLLFGNVAQQPELPCQLDGSFSNQTAENLNLDSVLDPSLWEDSPMDFTNQSQEQPNQQQQAVNQQRGVLQPVQGQSVHHEASEVDSAQRAMEDDDLFGDIDFDQQSGDSMTLLAEFNAGN